jgi:hypothetical protein
MSSTEIGLALDQTGDDAGSRRNEQPLVVCDVGSVEVAKATATILALLYLPHGRSRPRSVGTAL